MSGRWGLFLLICCFLVGCTRLPGRSVNKDALFTEAFDSQSDGSWQLEGDNLGRAEVIDGRLILTINAPATVQYVTLENQVFSDFVVEVEAEQLSQQSGISYGLLLRMAAPGQFYRFEVTTNGEYMVERHDGAGNWARLTDGWQPSAAILQGANQVNKLGVGVVGGRFSFYANDTLLTQVFDDAYRTGAIALDAGTFNQSELQVAFDNLVVSAP